MACYTIVSKEERGIMVRKNVIFVRLWEQGWYMDFMYKGDTAIDYLFSMKFNKDVFDYFRDGKSIEQLHRCKDWKKNSCLTRLVEKRIPWEIKKRR